MAILLTTTSFNGANGTHFYLKFFYNLDSQSIPNNTSTVTYTAIVGSKDGYSGSGAALGYSINGTNYTSSVTSIPVNSERTLGTATVSYIHDNNTGAYTAFASATCSSVWSGLGSSATTTSFALPTIPRYATITSFYISALTEYTATFVVTADVAIDYVQYSLSGGGWVDSGNQVISNLMPSTQYSLATRVRRTDSQQWTTSTTIYFTTNALRYATITAFSLAVPNVLGRLIVNWNADVAVDSLYYSINGGTWIAASGLSFNIDGLTNATQHSVKIKIRRQDSGLWTESSLLYATTSASVIRQNIGGTWKSGLPYINVNGTCKLSDMVYINVGGTWKESI